MHFAALQQLTTVAETLHVPDSWSNRLMGMAYSLHCFDLGRQSLHKHLRGIL